MRRKLLDGSRKREAIFEAAVQKGSAFHRTGKTGGSGRLWKGGGADPRLRFFERALVRGEATGRGQGKVKRSGNGDMAVTWRKRGAEPGRCGVSPLEGVAAHEVAARGRLSPPKAAH